ncbi:MAG TPA: Hsp20/alpha crystallin family protein [Methylomirabilota bacterium]|jgi:HSP20 family protein|nr:Hsp20/alpha crystallin family protein [Methylomirabilota bacterium]
MMLGRELTPWQNPFGLLSSFRRDMDELFNRFFGDWERGGTPWASMMGAVYAPRVESCVQDNTLLIRADLPGVDPKDVEITVEGNQLTLKGERKAQQEAKEGNYFHREVSYGGFARTFTIPEGVKAEDVHATYRNGVLELSIPLPASMVAKKIPIEIGGEERKQIAA